MNNSPKKVRDTLYGLIREVARNAPLYARNPERDFTRKRKLSLEKLLLLLLGMEGGSLANELLRHFGYTPDAASPPAFVQQRAKLLPEALEFIFQRFAGAFPTGRLYRGYRLLAMDGSDVQIPTDPADLETYFPGSRGQKPFNITKIGALYDLLGRTYVDALVRGKAVANENKMLVEMAERSSLSDPVILIADRNFECYDTMARLERRGWNYIIRAKEHKGILSGLDLPDAEEFDLRINLSLTRKQTKEVKPLLKDRNCFRFIPSTMRFELLDPKTGPLFYQIPFRVVRFKLDNGCSEVLLTNLDPSAFPPAELKRLYAMRWGIETSFRELKYTVGLLYFHGKKAAHIRQEIFARLIMYNFTEFLTVRAVVHKPGKKHAYRANFSAAVNICRHFFLGRVDSDHVESLISRHLSPVRPGRKNPRKLRLKEPVSFIYRIA